jgi:hypothetical protein
LLGVPLEYTDAEIAEIMSAKHFVAVRTTHGGPAPAETGRALAESAAALQADREWVLRTGDALTLAEGRLAERSRAL